MSDAGERLAEKGKSWLGAIQSVGPAAKRGRIGHAIRVFECRRGFFPGIALHKAPSQSLTARQQTVVGVWERKQWKKGEGLPATSAATPTDPNPVVMRIVGLHRFHNTLTNTFFYLVTIALISCYLGFPSRARANLALVSFC